MKFVVEGTYGNGKTSRKFVKEIEAQSEARAREMALSNIGSDHHIGRSRISIKSVGRLENAGK